MYSRGLNVTTYFGVVSQSPGTLFCVLCFSDDMTSIDYVDSASLKVMETIERIITILKKL